MNPWVPFIKDVHPPVLESPYYGPGTWPQPPRESILIDDTHALMEERVFTSLAEYSTSIPTGVYPGKMWRRHDGAWRGMDTLGQPRATQPEWLFCWYAATDDPAKCSINHRRVILV